MIPHDPALATYTARLLTGTGLTPSDAADAAAGRTPATGLVTAALRDGWTTHRPQTPADPEPTHTATDDPDDDTDEPGGEEQP